MNEKADIWREIRPELEQAIAESRWGSDDHAPPGSPPSQPARPTDATIAELRAVLAPLDRPPPARFAPEVAALLRRARYAIDRAREHDHPNVLLEPNDLERLLDLIDMLEDQTALLARRAADDAPS